MFIRRKQSSIDKKKGKDKIKKTGPFDCYGESYIYRYKKNRRVYDRCIAWQDARRHKKDIQSDP